jgi:hypothetical protein
VTLSRPSNTSEHMYIRESPMSPDTLVSTLLGELGFDVSKPLLLLLNNQSAIHVARNPEHHGRMKHLDLHFYWLRDVVVAGQIVIQYVPTVDLAADLLTKGLACLKVAAALPQLGLTAP